MCACTAPRGPGQLWRMIIANHPNRGWRKRWTIDLVGRTATHQNGFAVVFRQDTQGWIHERVLNERVVSQLDHARLIEQATELFTRAAGAVDADKCPGCGAPRGGVKIVSWCSHDEWHRRSKS